MFKIATFLTLLRDCCGVGVAWVWVWRVCAAGRVSEITTRTVNGGVLVLGAVVVSVFEADGFTMSSAFSMPFLARGVDDSRAGIVLFTVAFAFLARTSFLFAAGWRLREGAVRPIVVLGDFVLTPFFEVGD